MKYVMISLTLATLMMLTGCGAGGAPIPPSAVVDQG